MRTPLDWAIGPSAEGVPQLQANPLEKQMKHIEDRIRESFGKVWEMYTGGTGTRSHAVEESRLLYEFVMAEIELDRQRCHLEFAKAMVSIATDSLEQQKQTNKILKTMVAQTVLDASLKALTDAVANATTVGVPSTPDATVLAFVAGVDTNTAHLVAGPGSPPATPAAPPTP